MNNKTLTLDTKLTRGHSPHRKRNIILTIVALAALVLVLNFSEELIGKYYVRILNTSAIYAIVALSLNLVNGFTGLFSLGQSGFMAIGAYTTALLVMSPEMKDTLFYLQPIVPFIGNAQLPFIVALLIGAALAAVAAFIIGWPVLRLRGDYLAIATLGFSEIIRVVITNAQSVTNGALGLKNIPNTANVWWCFGVLAVVVIFLLLLFRTSYGRAFKAIRDDEIAAENMGISIFRHKMISFVMSGFIAGLGGGLLASVVGAVDPTQFRFLLTYNILLMVVLGGQGSISGSVVGAFIVTFALELLRVVDGPINFGLFEYPGVSGMRMVIFSLLLVIVILFWRKGIFGSNEFSWDRFLGGFLRFGRWVKRLFARGSKPGAPQNPQGGEA